MQSSVVNEATEGGHVEHEGSGAELFCVPNPHFLTKPRTLILQSSLPPTTKYFHNIALGFTSKK